jgi:hypothetical protein
MKQALHDAPAPTRYDVVVHTHGVRMVDIPWRDQFFFIVRDPIDRFVSGFDSRLRQGAPRFHEPWTPDEGRAFERFPSAVDLGLALAAHGSERIDAEQAMHSIGHVKTSYWDWFASPAAIRRRERDILWIGFVEELDAEIPALAKRLGLPGLELPSDAVAAHRSTSTGKPALPPEAREALALWYREDYEFVDLCRELAVRIESR